MATHNYRYLLYRYRLRDHFNYAGTRYTGTGARINLITAGTRYTGTGARINLITAGTTNEHGGT